MENEKDSREIIRDYLGFEMSDPAVAKAKKKLIRDHFSLAGVWFPVLWAVPAVALVACLAVYPIYNLALKSEKTIEIRPQKDARVPLSPKSVSTETKESAPIDAWEELPSVAVDCVESDAGEIMVYKQNYDDNPITVIWVFPGG
jgi:hypothetical protein